MSIKTIAFVLLILTLGIYYLLPNSDVSPPNSKKSLVDVNLPERKKTLVVALSFDYEDMGTDEGERNLPEIFRILEKHDTNATFFILGITARRKPESVQEIFKRGHSLGVHTYYHNFPIFEKEDAGMIAEVYNTSSEYVWVHSFKTKSAFYSDLKRTQLEIMNAVDNATIPRLFRSPSLVVNWTVDKRYFDVLNEAGMEIDSSVYQDFSNPRAHYIENGIVEIPVTASEARLNIPNTLYNITENYVKAGVPLVLFLHPHKLNESTLAGFDNFLSNLEHRYDVQYVKIEDVPTQ